MRAVVLQYIMEYTTQDLFHEITLCCYEALDQRRRFSKKKAVQYIHEMLKRRREEYYRLYNPRRNISLNQSFGESDIPVSEWLDLSKWLDNRK